MFGQDAIYKLGAKVVFTKQQLDRVYGEQSHDFYNEERFIEMHGQQYILRKPAAVDEFVWQYNEVYETNRADLQAHENTDYGTWTLLIEEDELKS